MEQTQTDQNQHYLDEPMREAILGTFAADKRTSSFELRVGVLNRIVHLAGQVDSIEIREIAEKIALGVPGVRCVVNRIEAPGAPNPARTINIDLCKK